MIDIVKKYWLYIVLFVVLFYIGFKLFYSNKKIELLDKTLIELEYRSELLNAQYIKQHNENDSLRKINNALFEDWKNRNVRVQIIKIKQKHDKERIKLVDTSLDNQFKFFTNWLSKENNNR